MVLQIDLLDMEAMIHLPLTGSHMKPLNQKAQDLVNRTEPIGLEMAMAWGSQYAPIDHRAVNLGKWQHFNLRPLSGRWRRCGGGPKAAGLGLLENREKFCEAPGFNFLQLGQPKDML